MGGLGANWSVNVHKVHAECTVSPPRRLLLLPPQMTAAHNGMLNKTQMRKK